MTDNKKGQPQIPEMTPEEKLEWGSVVAIRAIPPTLQGTTDEQRVVMEKALVRKLDLRLMPMLALIYIMNYLDRNAIAAAKLSGITEELNLTSVQFQVYVPDWIR
ncbi:MFS general substrate transporter [Aspergillus affinis]|uniref:MFS general substrate transporter n=1 Tax=Aspergillus affinis TaxID=1070780 RepID=UPI0022FDDED2|nr:MFS general substrate transporter [Aspergillus affinis]KAI9041802.1 MFS general substrate transporter [Aspergillus affinis]